LQCGLVRSNFCLAIFSLFLSTLSQGGGRPGQKALAGPRS
jgi:hypothetical protein